MAVDEVENHVRRSRQNINQVPPGSITHLVYDGFWRQPKPGVHQSNIPPGTAKADIVRLNQGNAGTRNRRFKRSCTACETTADNRQINA
jgi:hypothetical protein